MLFLLIVLIPLFVAVIGLVLRGLIRLWSAPAEENRCFYCDVMEEHHKASIHGLTQEQLAKHQREVLSKAKIIVLAMVVALPVWVTPAHALFGGDIVFDPTMYARQLRQLQQEMATVTNLAQQLQYVIKNTTGGGGGAWASNQNLLTNLGGIISEQEGLSYSVENLAQQFQQLYPGFQSAGGPPATTQVSMDTALNTLNGVLQSVQMQANNFQAEQLALSTLEVKNNAAIGQLQAIQTGNEVALAEAQQIQELRQLMMSTINAQAVASGAQANAQAASEGTAMTIVGTPAKISPW